jgi:hypothetical protein
VWAGAGLEIRLRYLRNKMQKSSVLISPLYLTGDHKNSSLAQCLSTREMNQYLNLWTCNHSSEGAYK